VAVAKPPTTTATTTACSANSRAARLAPRLGSGAAPPFREYEMNETVIAATPPHILSQMVAAPPVPRKSPPPQSDQE
jgi:hypothetical protein